jgi:hypothetical protein
MDRNLGASLASDAGAADGWAAGGVAGNYYQWGRKDPFPGPAELGATDGNRGGYGIPAHTKIASYVTNSAYWSSVGCIMFYNGAGARDATNPNSIWLGTKLGAGYATDEAVEYSVKYPHKWLKNTAEYEYSQSPHHWWGDYDSKDDDTKEDYRYLWGAPTAGNSYSKSIYDPCPPGWMVMYGGVNSSLSGETKALSSKGYGIEFQTSGVFLPVSGQRTAEWGTITGVAAASGNSRFDLWNCNVYSSGTGYYIQRYDLFTSGGTINSYPNSNTFAGYGFQVRCMKEK